MTELKTITVTLNEKVERLQTPTNIVIRKEHVFIVNFRRSKTAIITMALFILLSWGGNIWQLGNYNQLKDNDLRYRYVRIKGKPGSQDLLRIEIIFTYSRN